MGSTDTIIAGLLVVSIVVSAVSLITPPQKLISLTGLSGFALATNATAQLSLTETVSVTFITSSASWGAVSVRANVTNPTTIYCDLYTVGDGQTNSTGNCASIATSTVQRLVLNNDGSENVSVQLASNTTAAQLLGGTSPAFQWIMKPQTGTQSCINMTPITLTNVNTTSPGTKICDRLDAIDANDTIAMGFYISIPSDTQVQGSRGALLTASATEVVD